MVDESETIAGGQAGETQQPTFPQPGTPPPPSPPPLSDLAQRAVDEYEQITLALAVVSSSVEAPPPLQEPCPPGIWCLPDVNCSARSFTSEAVRTAFSENREVCEEVIIEG